MAYDIVTEFHDTGECPIDVEKTLTLWDKDWCISQWHEEYTLCHHDPTSDNFTKTDFKVRISKVQAHELIGKANLIMIQSAVFTNGKTWRRKEHINEKDPD